MSKRLATIIGNYGFRSTLVKDYATALAPDELPAGAVRYLETTRVMQGRGALMLSDCWRTRLAGALSLIPIAAADGGLILWTHGSAPGLLAERAALLTDAAGPLGIRTLNAREAHPEDLESGRFDVLTAPPEMIRRLVHRSPLIRANTRLLIAEHAEEAASEQDLLHPLRLWKEHSEFLQIAAFSGHQPEAFALADALGLDTVLDASEKSFAVERLPYHEKGLLTRLIRLPKPLLLVSNSATQRTHLAQMIAVQCQEQPCRVEELSDGELQNALRGARWVIACERSLGRISRQFASVAAITPQRTEPLAHYAKENLVLYDPPVLSGQRPNCSIHKESLCQTLKFFPGRSSMLDSATEAGGDSFIQDGVREGFWKRTREGLQLLPCGELLAERSYDSGVLLSWRTILRRFPEGGGRYANSFLALAAGDLSRRIPLSKQERADGVWPDCLLTALSADNSALARYFSTYLSVKSDLSRHSQQAAKAVMSIAAYEEKGLDEAAKYCGLPRGETEFLVAGYLTIIEDLHRLATKLGSQLTAEPAPCAVKRQPEPANGARLILDMESQQVEFQGKLTQLTRNQAVFLELLAKNAGSLVRYERFLNTIWPDGKVQRQQISYYRKVINDRLQEVHRRQTPYVETVSQVGLIFQMRPSDIQIRKEAGYRVFRLPFQPWRIKSIASAVRV